MSELLKGLGNILGKFGRGPEVSDTLTKVEIRVGTFGDKAISTSIYDRIKGNL